MNELRRRFLTEDRQQAGFLERMDYQRDGVDVRMKCIFKRLILFLAVIMLFSIGMTAKASSVDVDREIHFTESIYVVYVGRQQKIDAVVDAVLDSAPNQTQLIWSSSNQEIATVNAAGMVTGKAAGTVSISAVAKDNESISTSVDVEVRVPVQAVQVNENNISVVVGGKEDAAKAQLTVTVKPENAFFQSGTWTSSNENVATVDSNGVVTGISAGTANIIFTSDDPNGQKRAQANVRVGQAVTAVNVADDMVVHVKKGVLLKTEVLPSNATNKKLEYVSSDPSIATVSQNGQVTGVANGEAIITCIATDGSDVSASVHVKVFQPVQSLKLEKTQLNAYAGKTSEPLIVTINPADALYQDVIWTSSDESIATVNERGEVTGIAGGKAQITATSTEPVSDNNKPKSVTCQVTVTQAVEYIWLEKNENKSTDKKLVLSLTVLPDTATNKKVKWTSSNTKVATVNGGTVTIKKHEGETIITATAEDGSGIYGSCRVHVGFSGAVFQIGNYVRRSGSYVWDVDSFDGNGSLDSMKNTLTVDDSKDKSELSEVELLLSTTRDEILFRELPWGSNLRVIKAQIDFDGFWEPEITEGGSYRSLEKHSFDQQVKVAGHTVGTMLCLFTYDVDEEDHLIKSNDMLYYAEYGLHDDNQMSRSEDIETKLLNKYGTADKTEENAKKKTLIWYGVNNTKLRYVLDDGSITITYEWLDGSKMRKKADAAYAKEQAEKVEEKPAYSPTTDGL